MADLKCPCCGSQMNAIGLDQLRYLHLPRLQRQVLDALIEAYPVARSLEAIANRVWALDPTGGPDTACNAVSVYMNRFRPLLNAMGWSVGRVGNKGIRLWAPGEWEQKAA